MNPEWRRLNRANWDERVPYHLGAPLYDRAQLRGGAGRLDAIAEARLGDVTGLRVAHLQCHMGDDTLCIGQRGADGLWTWPDRAWLPLEFSLRALRD